MTDPDKLALTIWEEMIREEAGNLADRDNSCDACCGPRGTATWMDYEAGVREHFEAIGKAYMSLRLKGQNDGTKP